MPNVTVTFDFTSEADAVAFLSGKIYKPHTEHHEPSAGRIENNTSTVMHVDPQTIKQPAPAPQPDAPAAKTPDDVNKAFVAYVQKGQGRTAATAKAILGKYGINSFREANPEQCAQLCAEFAAS